MSDTLIIDTGSSSIVEEKIEPLPLYDDNYPMLSMVMPEYNQKLPNVKMTTIVKSLKMTMKLYGGIGLSANQCGIKERVFIIGTDYFQLACINPKVISMSEDLQKENEGCLSFPGLYLRVDRPSSIDVEFTTENGEVKQMHLEGLTARCFLHELDHMNGIKFTSHVKPLSLQMAKKKQQKVMKKVLRNRK
jgi:peptide deformylase